MFRASQIYGRPPQAPTRAFQGASDLTSTWWEAATPEKTRRGRAGTEEKRAQERDADYATTDATSNDSQWTAWDEAAHAERKRKRHEEREAKAQRAREEEAKRLKEAKAQRAREEEAKRLKEEATQKMMEDVARMFKEAKEKETNERAKEKPRDFRKLFKRGQKYLTPPISDATRAFYESLLEEKPKSHIAIKYCVEHGLMGREAHAELFAKYTLIKEHDRMKAARAKANKWKKLDPRAPAKSPKLSASKTPTQK